ncbi:thioredoxin [Frateuria aurantia]|uniref:Thioredoxin n=1 Tax=Frateuria aurantia (strain ATCC 33424 / DSM 6220 / KCTC 2777 / LMG 1558 / NBRC 3245 / NCIMB 13370) TaxID=767434 RepID=H8L6I4_FRAAD|nr:thioredoxin [Frateuria aurantia]AFC85973.1 thioredoxin [Frateuria aurantia DSM 6220]
MSTDLSAPHVFDVNQENFESDVVQGSLSTPILIDFWATWCEPCKTLGPMLEKLAAQYQGAFRLAKIDVDQNGELAGMFGIRSIPTVVLLKNGEIADGFSGALTEGQLREFLDKHIEAPSAQEPAAEEETAEESPAAAIRRLQSALAAEPERSDLKLDLAEALLDEGRPADMKPLLESLPADIAEDARVLRLRAALEFSQELTASPDDAALAQQIADDEQDWAARDQLALRHFFGGQAETALQSWLLILQHARDWNDGQARQRLLKAFSLLQDLDLVGRYRRRMASLLF